MTGPNAAWLYYKRYYQAVDFTVDPNDRNSRAGKAANERNANHFEAATEPFWQVELPRRPYDPLGEHLAQSQSFELATTYPGLLIGSGYQHETGHQGELKLGFSFDHSTGLPVIPGSSVKGMLRSCFRHWEMIRDLLEKPDWGEKQVLDLEEEIFGKAVGAATHRLSPVAPSLRDAFFDAIPVDTQNGTDRKLFDLDYLTPHNPRKGELGRFKEPIPIAFLKVRPGIVYRFRFQLHDGPSTQLNVMAKYLLFQQLIELFGLGAKTNVGYGQWVPTTASPQSSAEPSGQPAKVAPLKTVETDDLPSFTYKELKTAYKRGKNLIGLVRNNENKQLTVELRLEGEVIRASINFPGSASVKLGARIRLKVSSPGDPAKKQAPNFGFGGYDR